MGAIVGALSGLIIGGVFTATEKRGSKVPWIVGLGIFGEATIGNAIYEALPPEC